MRIQGPVATPAAAAGPAARRAPSGSFSLPDPEAARAASPSPALRTVGGIDALIALQGLDDPAERRRQALKRGRVALDALDELKIGLLGGELSPATLTRLRSAAAFLKDGSGEAGLDRLLGEIELRLEVEIAKLTPR
jgi:hypothetical protein